MISIITSDIIFGSKHILAGLSWKAGDLFPVSEWVASILKTKTWLHKMTSNVFNDLGQVRAVQVGVEVNNVFKVNVYDFLMLL